MHPRVTIRPAVSADLEAITGIYNEAVLTTTATFDTEPRGLREQIAGSVPTGEGSPFSLRRTRASSWGGHR